jgi:8-oxo-dGTP pyrophosphatase MutT (NUDIX family)
MMNFFKYLLETLKGRKKQESLPEIKMVNQPCYDKYGRFIGWFSRSMASAMFVFCKDKAGNWYVLASERGEEAADFRGFWNCSCGYLDYNETTKDCAMRELYEETGILIDEDVVNFVNYEDSPEANRQNVTFRFAAFIEDSIIDDFTFSKKNNEGKEVGEIKWIKVDEIDDYMWAFNHDKRIKEIFNTRKE